MKSAEIVKALRHCATVDGSGCFECPAIDSSLKSELDCDVLMKTEAADLIERLEKEKAALLECVKWRCDMCKNFSGSGMRKRCWETWECQQCNIECSCRGCNAGSKWERKGVEGNDGTTDI